MPPCWDALHFEGYVLGCITSERSRERSRLCIACLPPSGHMVPIMLFKHFHSIIYLPQPALLVGGR